MNTGVKGAVDRATDSRALQWAARAGYPISGILHLLIALIIVRIATGSSGEADQTGALATIARTAFGVVSLWIVAIGLLGLALWRLAEALVGLHPGEGSRKARRGTRVPDRLKALGLAAVYCAVAVTAMRFALGSRHNSSQQTAGVSARMMQSDGGRALLVIIGVAIAVIGGYYVYKGAAKKFLDDLTVPGGRLLIVLGVGGYVAEGLVLAASGVLIIAATFYSDPAKATGLDGAVKALGRAPFGPVVLIAAAAGFAAYGLYSFALTRYSRM